MAVAAIRESRHVDASQPARRARLQDWLPKLGAGAELRGDHPVFVYGFILWTVYLSFTSSKTAARPTSFVGLRRLLAALVACRNWWSR